MYHIILNSYWEPLEFELPVWPSENGWRRLLDTSLDAPNELLPLEKAPLVTGTSYLTQPRSMVVLISG
jgi:glycogen operon protein